MNRLLVNLVLGFVALGPLTVSTSAWAGKFQFEFQVMSQTTGGVPPFSHDQCEAKALPLEQKLLGIIKKGRAKLTRWDKAVEVRNYSDEYAVNFRCTLAVAGEADKEISIVTLDATETHLKRQGYTKKNYLKACDRMSAAFALNPNEIDQFSYVNITATLGRECIVVSSVLMVE